MSEIAAAMIAVPVALVAGAALALWWRRGQEQLRRMVEAEQAVQMRQVERMQAAVEERQRIYGDLHDDIGAKLVTLIHSLENEAHADLARAVMQDLRDIVSRSSRADGSLLEILAQIRDETEQRLESLGLGLAWEQDRDLQDPQLDDGQALHLFRIVREAVTNALRHAQPQSIRIRCRAADEYLWLDVTDDGPGPDARKPGAGTCTMQRRAADLRGSISWDAGTEGGTKVVLKFPLPESSG